MPAGPLTIKRDNENINSVLKRFRRECNRSGIKNELKRRRFFLSPSVVKNVKISKIKRLRMKDRRRDEKRQEFVKTKKRRG